MNKIATRENAPETTPVVENKEQHIDDFLNHLESLGRRELAAAFALYAKVKGFIKKEVKDWETEFEKFAKMTPEDLNKEMKSKGGK